MKISRKQLKTVLILRVRNFDLAFVILNLVKFLFFDNFFPDLAKFKDLDIFSLFDFLNLDNFFDLAYFILFLPISNLSTLLSPSFFSEASLLLSFLLKTDLLPSFLLRVDLLGNSIVFNIKVSGIVILLKP